MPYKKKVSYLMEARANNNQALGNFRIWLAITAGIVSGVLGFDGLLGFLVFVVYAMIGTLIYIFKLGGGLSLYYTGYGEVISSWKNGMMEYILTWIMFYNMIYVLS
ncbi:hypothetical protein SteCoe_33316 [Stentor coeruleus]|uniref:ER membrane protein complex subunit 6 n=1 Tax=Stentor coeruleus TaxID=5963 RepID=A0A1R2AWZ9_9CILI|nr:hypothetical protein SteCoe_33316 [Stentor coeruleus]